MKKMAMVSGQRKCHMNSFFLYSSPCIDKNYHRKTTNNYLTFILTYFTILNVCLFANGNILRKSGSPQQPLDLIVHPTKVETNPEGYEPILKLNDGGRTSLLKVPMHPVSVLSLKVRKKRSDDDGPLKSEANLPPNSKEDGNPRLNATTALPVAKSGTQQQESVSPEMAVNVKPVNTTKDVSVDSSNPDKVTGNGANEEVGLGPPSGLKPDAVLRLFYVFIAIGVIVLIYILVKFIRVRRRRATRKYRVLAHSDEQEMFPLAADDGDDEEIFNAADHHSLK